MKTTLLDPSSAEAIIERFKKLTPDSRGRWGHMQVTEMLLHCTLANRFVLEDRSPYCRPGFKQRLKKFACLHIITKLPRNRIGPPRLQTRNKISADEFEAQKNAAIASVTAFSAHQGAITSLHAAMGYLTNKEWGIVAWMHMDHHLRQFGV